MITSLGSWISFQTLQNWVSPSLCKRAALVYIYAWVPHCLALIRQFS